MIDNEKQYNITKQKIIEFNDALTYLRTIKDSQEPYLEVQIASMQSQVDEMIEDVKKYDDI